MAESTDATRVVAVAASLGGVSALIRLLRTLPASCPYALLVVLHRAPTPAATDALVSVLAPRCRLPVRVARPGEPLTEGTVVVAPPHTAIGLDAAGALVMCTAEARHVADTTFTELAGRLGPRLIAVVLTGLLDDGAAGVRSVKGAGGQVLVQDPAEARAPAMPAAALADAVLPLDGIAAHLIVLVSRELG
jgi:two-component system, chemotaxis family, protein-glutamate methylesterase/glutaminase